MCETPKMKIGAHCLLACLYFLLLPTTIAVNSAGASYLKLATIPIAAYFVITIIFSRTVLQFNSVHLLLAVYTLSTLITLFVNHDANCMNAVTGYFLNAALYLCLTVVRYNKRELELLEDVQILLLAILIIMTLFSGGSRFDRTTLEIFGQTTDPNYFAGFFILPYSVTLKKTVEAKHCLGYGVLLLLGLYCVFLSGSRGGLLAVVMTVVAFALIYPTKTRNKIPGLLLSCVTLLCAWFVLAPFLPEDIIARMSVRQVVETGGTGRWYIWESMLNEIANSTDQLLLGRGVDTVYQMFISGRWESVGSHNHVIQLLYNQGLLGLIIFVALITGGLARCIKKRKTVAIAILGMLVLSVSLSFNTSTKTFWNLVAYAAMNFPPKESRTSIENHRSPEGDQL